MRFLIKVSIPVESGNKAAKEGRLSKIIGSILEDLKPEAAYFFAENRQRTGLIFFHVQDNSEIPKVGEPWMLGLNASIEIHPAMSPEDLQKAEPYIEEAVRKYS
ncbi:MAG: hypothetical protein HY913_21815 [Desulfomonile tiedjei]|nr:hypothetical protein [Desulfomonile tiedjei]